MRASSPPLSWGVAGAARPLTSRKTRVLVCAGFCAIVALLALRTARECNVPGRPDLPRFGMQDFRDAIYFPAAAFRDGANPYDARRYTRDYPVFSALGPYAPAVLLLYTPFTALTLPRAEVVFLILNVALAPVLAALLLLSRQGQSTVYLGQSMMYVLIGTFAALHYARTRPWLAGLGFAVAALKPTFGIPLALLMLCRRERAPVVIGTAVCGMLSLIAIGLLIQGAGGVGPVRDAFASSPGAFLAVPHNTT